MFREPLKNSAYTEEFIGAPASGRFMHFNKEGVCVCERERVRAYVCTCMHFVAMIEQGL